ncbi:error-prone DNA polymerase [Polycladidibacter hongkongensis]|uniref:error-prone DNA polymerase n=1 Tax=Polycladidibacter hongkongensis TaxID=1647556 RepID=UPI00082E7E8D|nr:error-prone DNA polymerase [Pseudovibrio hongkongensis]
MPLSLHYGSVQFSEMCCASNFSFLRGASHPEELAFTAAKLGMPAIGICDRNSLAGIVRLHVACREAKVRAVTGCRLAFQDDTPDIVVWPQNRAGYGQLCQLLSTGNRRAPKGQCFLRLDDLLALHEGLSLAVLPSFTQLLSEGSAVERPLEHLQARFGKAVRLAAVLDYGKADRRKLERLLRLSDRCTVPLLASNDVLYHEAARRPLQDVLSCIRLHTTLQSAGKQLEANSERHLKDTEQMQELFQAYPPAVQESQKLLDEIEFSLDELRYEYPQERYASGLTAQDELTRLAWVGARERYGAEVPDKVRKAICHELHLIGTLEYAPYFLTVHDIVAYAKSQGILCQGRGSAANSAVCFCLGITEVDPKRADLLFERFISPERKEPPDIDVDFEHERREEVIQYIYRKYGREHAGLAATVITYRSRSALREVAKVFNLSQDAASAMAQTIWGRSSKGGKATHIAEAGLYPNDPVIAQVLKLSQELIGFPRHLSQHVGGFVITRRRLDESVPIMNGAMPDRTHIEWDKDDLEAIGMLKIDVLALGMLTALRKGMDLLHAHYGKSLALASIPAEESEVYDMICRADTLGVFQIESRAQMTMLPRLRPRNFYDLVIEVAIVRPGPIQGDMVHPYLRRRQKKEMVHYPKDELREVLQRTLGVPLFQEQAMQIAIVAAGFEPAEADRLRRAMATFRRVGTIGTFQRKMIEGMTARGYEKSFAERCFKQIEGFGEYGFPESHAASFALLVYASCWLKARYPDAFLAAMLNAQPLGFYAPAQLVRDAREHGVDVRDVDINLSNWDSTLEPGGYAWRRVHMRHSDMQATIKATHAVRLGFRQVKGLSQEDMHRLVQARGNGYDSLRDLWLRTGLSRSVLIRLAEADAFRSIGLARRGALWAAHGLEEGSSAQRLPLFDSAQHGDLREEQDAQLPPMLLGEQVMLDYRKLELSLRAHPVEFARADLNKQRILPCDHLGNAANGSYVEVAGLVLVRQRPGTASGVIFLTLEDESGTANVVIWPRCFEKYRAEVIGTRFIKVRGRVQKEDGVIHLIATQISEASNLLAGLGGTKLLHEALARADEVRAPLIELAEKIKPGRGLAAAVKETPELSQDYLRLADYRRESNEQTTVLPKGRNFM